MNAQTSFRPRVTFTAWRMCGEMEPAHAYQLFGTTRPAIEREIAIAANHGSTIFLLEADAVTDGRVLHVYVIQRGKAIYTGEGRTYPHAAKKLFALPVSAFDPVLPWSWSPGCDVVGKAAFIEGGVL